MSTNGTVNGSVPDYVLRAEYEELEERVEGLLVGIHRANAGIQRIESLLKRQATTLAEHSIALGDIGSAIMRIETRLSTHDKVIEQHDRAIDDVEDKADRASRPDETAQAIAQVYIEDKRDSIAARKDRRNAVWSVVGKASAWLFVGGGAALIVMALAKSCGVDLPTP